MRNFFSFTMDNNIHRFVVILLIACVGLGIIGNGEASASGGSFDVPQVNDHFDKFEKGPAPKKEVPITQDVKEEKGTWDWITQPISDAWDWTVDRISGVWDWFSGVLELLTSIVIVVVSFLKGVGKAFVDAIVGIWDVITNPIDTLTNIFHAIMNPIDALQAMWQVISDSFMRDVVNGDANSAAEWFGYAAGQILLAIVSAKGADKLRLLKGAKAVPDGQGKGFLTGLGQKLINLLPGPLQKFFTKDGFTDLVKSVKTSIDDLLRGNKVNHKMAVLSGLVGTAMVGVSFTIPFVKPFIKKLDDCFTYQQPTQGYFAAVQFPFPKCFYSPDTGGGSAGGTANIKVNNMKEFFELDFGKSLKKSTSKTSARYKGAPIYRIDKKVDNPYLKKGDGFYLDTLHYDHIEVVDSRGKVKAVLNLDGTLNTKKTEEALKQGRKVKW